VWSIGCIFGELLNGKPIFPGKEFVSKSYAPPIIDLIYNYSYVDQLKCIFEYLGSPSDKIVKRIARGRVSYNFNLAMLKLKFVPIGS
jgi:mitogen-activated protein kinase 7